MEDPCTLERQDTASVQKKTRTRTGCLNCRRRRRKCDGKQNPGCLRCKQRDEECEWGAKVIFRPDNAATLSSEHPSMLQEGSRKRARNFQIMDVTSQIEEECQQEISRDSSRSFIVAQSPEERHRHHDSLEIVEPNGAADSLSWDSRALPVATTNSVDLEFLAPMNVSIDNGLCTPSQSCREEVMPQSLTEGTSNREGPSTSPLHLEDAAAELLALRYVYEPSQVRMSLSNNFLVDDPENTPPIADFEDVESHQNPSHNLSDVADLLFPPETLSQELDSTLRDHFLHTCRSNAVTRCGTPEPQPSDSRSNITPKREYELWKNWIDEVAPWLDKFDNKRHFEHQIPIMAKSSPHLKNSLLALSARQLERKGNSSSSAESLALYQEALHLLLPELHSRSPAVLGSCVILCVLEMMSCSSREWRRHLEGCAKLLEIAGINGFVGGIEGALFWCFVRMDVCGALISEDSTLIPACHFASTGNMEQDVKLFRDPTESFDTYANYAVFLGATCLSYISDYNNRSTSATDAARRWTELYDLLDEWEHDIPGEMKPILTIPADDKGEEFPFPTVLYGNAPAVSGNQLYHTAMLLLLQNKPQGLDFNKKQKSIFWHARQICAISESNTHHGAWTNSIQPIWIAGKIMSHHSEHRAILRIYERIERETGWVTSWRRDDLKRWWGYFDD